MSAKTSKTSGSKKTTSKPQGASSDGFASGGNAVIYVLVALVVVAVGALAYLSGQMAGEQRAAQDGVVQQVAEGAEAGPVIRPGNPVVAKVGGEDILREDVALFIQQLPEERREQPILELFPAALEQVINAKVVELEAKNVNLDSDPLVKERLAEAKARIVQTVYLQNQIDKKLTDEAVQQAYDTYLQNFPNAEEVRASHILVDDEALAKSMIAQLNDGAEFAVLARENSKDTTAQNGGDLGYFLQIDVVPEFGNVAFTLEPGSYTKEPVQTQFGYHVIRVEDKRKREPAALDAVQPLIENQLRQQFLDEILADWRGKVQIERFDINGDALPADVQNNG